MTEDHSEAAAKTLAELHVRRKKCIDFPPLEDGQEKVYALPAFDFRNNTDGDEKYGQHSVDLVFARRKGDVIVDVSFFTGWSVDGARVISDEGKDLGFMCLGTGTHYVKESAIPKSEVEYVREHDDCAFTGGKCWASVGSALYGDVILTRLVTEGSYGVWDEIEKELAGDES